MKLLKLNKVVFIISAAVLVVVGAVPMPSRINYSTYKGNRFVT
jgi:hypothetical protein